MATAAACAAVGLLASCGDDSRVDTDDIPRVDGTSVTQDFERPNRIYPAQLRVLVVEGPEYANDDALARAERSLLIAEGWRIAGEPHEPRVGRAGKGDETFSLRFGPPGPMIRVSGLAPGERLQPLDADRPPTIIIQASPHEQTPE